MTLRRFVAVPLALFLILYFSGCASDSTPCPKGQTEVNGQCVAESDGTADGFVADTNVPDSNVQQDVFKPDTNVNFDSLTCQDGFAVQNNQCVPVVDNTQPTVTKITVTPGTDGTPVTGVGLSPTLEVTFSEEMQTNSVYGNSPSGSLFLVEKCDKTSPATSCPAVEISGLTFANTNSVANFKTKNPLKVATVYVLYVTVAAKDVAGNFLEKQSTFEFITTGPDNHKKYEDLAVKYAPVIYQEVTLSALTWDLPLAMDFDGDWNLKNNANNSANNTQQVLKPYIYWTVRETTHKAETTKLAHFYITYVLYYPMANNGDYKMVNHTSGLTIVVEKNSDGTDKRPVAALLHYQQSNDIHQMRVYGVKDAMFETSTNSIDKTFDTVAEVFKNGTTFELFIPTGRHSACSWLDNVSGVGEWCEQPNGKDNVVEMTLSKGAPDTVNVAALITASPKQLKYDLKSWLLEVWPRRDDAGDTKVWSAVGTFTAPSTRPGGGTKRATTFTGDTNAGALGRSPFGWKEDGNVALGANDPSEWSGNTGVHFFDPAFLMVQRLIQPVTGATWALDYCFHPYFSIDERGNFTDCTK